MNEPQIPAADQENIDALVRQFRNRIENLYRMAYLQGQIDQAEADRRKMKEEYVATAAR